MSRLIRSLQEWHWAQLLSCWAVCLALPWRVPYWGEWLLDNRFREFLYPGSGQDPIYRTLGMVGYWALPLLAVVVTAVWVAGRMRRREVV